MDGIRRFRETALTVLLEGFVQLNVDFIDDVSAVGSEEKRPAMSVSSYRFVVAPYGGV